MFKAIGISYGKTILIALVLLASPPLFAENQEPPTAADYADPVRTYRAYLEAIKRDDLAAARTCHHIDEKNGAVLDVAVGIWVAHHRFNKLVASKFGEHESPFLRADCTDQALDRTLARLAKSTFKITGNSAELTIHWEEEDGSPDEVFCFTGDETIPFRKVGDQWKIELEHGDNSSEWLAPGSWGRAFREGAKLLNEASDDIESGKFSTWKQVSEILDQKSKKLAEQWARDHQDP
jgi:hypothetical protein